MDPLPKFKAPVIFSVQIPEPSTDALRKMNTGNVDLNGKQQQCKCSTDVLCNGLIDHAQCAVYCWGETIHHSYPFEHLRCPCTG